MFRMGNTPAWISVLEASAEQAFLAMSEYDIRSMVGGVAPCVYPGNETVISLSSGNRLITTGWRRFIGFHSLRVGPI